MRFLSIVLVAIVGIAIAIGSFLFVVAPADLLRDQLIAEVKRQTGRTLTVKGGASFSVYPFIGIKLRDVALSMPPGMTGSQPFASAKSLSVAVPLAPLLQQQLEIDAISVRQPVVRLITSRDGSRSWEFASQATSQARRLRRATAVPGGRPSLQLGAIGKVSVVDGMLIIGKQNRKAGTQLADITFTATGDGQHQPLSVRGYAAKDSQRFDYELQLRNGEDLTALVKATQGARLELSGKLRDLNDSPRFIGRLVGKTDDLRQTAELASLQLPDRDAFRKAEIDGRITATADRLTFSKSDFRLGDTTFNGDILLDLDQAKPRIQGQLATDLLDLDELLLPASARPAKAPRKASLGANPFSIARANAQTIPAPAPPPNTGNQGSSDELRFDLPSRNGENGRTGTSTQRQTDRRAWSDAPLDWSALHAVNANVKITAESIHYRALKTSNASVGVSVENGRLEVRSQRAALYNGRADVSLTALAIGDRPSVTGRVIMNNVETLSLLRDLSGFDWIAGRATLTVEFNASGNSEQALISALDGRGQFKVNDGAIVGIDIPEMLRQVKQGDLSGLQRQEAKSTEFTALDGSFTILGGIVQTNNTRLDSANVKVRTAGTVTIPNRRLDLQVEPRVIGENQAGIDIPFRVRGPWRKPRVIPDLNGILKNPDTVIDAAKNLGKKFRDGKIKGKDVENLLKGLFGGR